MSIRKKLNDTMGRIPYLGNVLTTEINKKSLVVLAFGGYMTISSAPALAANVTVEAVSDKETVTLDTKVSGIMPCNIGYFFRNRTSIDYENNDQIGSFSLLDITYPLGKGFDIVAEGQFADGLPFDPRLGVQYFKGFDNGLTFYALVTRNFNENPNTEMTTILGYARDIIGKFRLAGRVEEVINIGDSSYNYDLTRLRLGLGNDQVTIGPSLDISNIGIGKEPQYSPGGFISVKIK